MYDEDSYEDDIDGVEGHLSTNELGVIEEKKTMLRRLLVLGFLVFLATFYFVWQNVLNFGYVEIYGKAPYDVMIYDEKSQDCNENPCTLKLKRGEKTLLFHKIGYEADSANATVQLWSTSSVKVDFELVPYFRQISSIEEQPTEPAYPKYEFKYNQTSHNWILVNKSTGTIRPLAYFPENPTSPKIIGSDNSVLIIEKSGKQVYFVDLNSKQKSDIGQLDGNLLRAKPSVNGQYFLLEVENDTGEKFLVIADKYKIWTPNIKSKFEETLWTLHAKLATMHKEENNHVFSIYSPDGMTEKTLLRTDQFAGKDVSVFFPSMKTNSIFFRVGEISYEIIY